ncbi:MAG: alpha/beta hydrolase [Clostridia bacterium]|nr:alpha/beta hydrolase [Clostridia bacterium]
MRVITVDLYEHFGVNKPQGARGKLTAYVNDYRIDRLRPAMLIVPGGGYSFCSEREREPIANYYIAEGFQSFTLDYSVAPVKYPQQLIEGCMAVAYIKENAEKFYVDKNHVATIGFSAGGHLAGMLATITDEQVVKDALKEKASLAKPDAVILAYPVITLVGKAHQATGDNLCGEDIKLKEYLSLDKRVTPSSVPAFIWSTVNDQIVPVESSLYMAAAYRENGVPFELHIFEDGIHGLSLANEEVDSVNVPVQAWKGACATWLKSRGFELIKRSI